MILLACEKNLLLHKQHHCLKVSVAADLTSLIFQQYKTGLSVELKKTSVDESVHARKTEEVNPSTATETEFKTIGR